MAYTDDINEKVAERVLEMAARAGSFGLDVGTEVGRTAIGLTQRGFSAAYKHVSSAKEMEKLNELSGRISLNEMNTYIEKLGLKSSTVRIAATDVEEYEQLLQREGVLYAKVDIKNDNASMIMFLDRDRERIEKVTQILQARRNMVTEVRPDMFVQDLAPENVRTLSGLDAVEVELFRHYARQEGILFTIIQNKETNNNMVAFRPEDIDKVRRVILHTGWDLTGANGARNREQISFRLSGRTALQKSIQAAEREVYIVSKAEPRNYVKISAEDMEVYKRGQLVSTVSRAERSPADFMIQCLAQADAMENAVLLDADRFRPDLTKEELAGMKSIGLRTPDYGDEIAQVYMQTEMVNLVQAYWEAENTLYFISPASPGDYVKISPDAIETYKDGELEVSFSSEGRNLDDYFDLCMKQTESLENPVLVEGVSYRPNFKPEELAKMSGIHAKNPANEAYAMAELKSLVAMKMSRDDEHNATWGLWDPSVSYSEFSGYEYITDQDAAAARPAEFEHFRDAAYYEKRNFDMQEIKLDTRSIDFLIAQAEIKRDRQAGGGRQREQEREEARA